MLAGLPDLVDHEAGVAELFASRTTVRDPATLLGLLATISRQIRERCGDVVKILRSGAAVEPDIAATVAEAFRRRRLGVEAIIARVKAEGGLRKGMTVTRAADVATALMTGEVCDALVERAGWSCAEYEKWLSSSLCELLR